MALSTKQQKFISEYLQCFNATEAALRAGYSERSARVIGSENLTKPDIAKAISQHMEESAMSANEVMMRLARHARGDVGQYLIVSPDGIEVDLEAALRDERTDLIKKVTHKKTIRTDKNDTTTEDNYVQIEMYDAQSALQLIGRHHALFTDRSEQNNTGEITVRVVYDDEDITPTQTA